MSAFKQPTRRINSGGSGAADNPTDLTAYIADPFTKLVITDPATRNDFGSILILQPTDRIPYMNDVTSIAATDPTTHNDSGSLQILQPT